MNFRKLLTSIKFTTTEWVDVARCALRDISGERLPALQLDHLESRVLYSASPLPVAVVGMESSKQDSGASISSPENGLSDATLPYQARTADDILALVDELTEELIPSLAEAEAKPRDFLGIDESVTRSEQPLPDSEVESTDGQTFEVVLLDTRLLDSDQLAAAVRSNALLFTYDSLTETAAQILDRVSTWADNAYARIESLTIVSHGASGAFQLGNQWVTSDSWDSTSDAWRQLAESLEVGANIYILGCDVATGSDGQQLLDQLAELTGADVFASDDVTGVGGDWTLEVASAGDFAELDSGWTFGMDRDSLAQSDVSLAWFDASWQYRQSVTINESMVTGSSNLSNFAVLVSLTDPNLRSTSNGGHVGQTDGGDFLFTSSDGTTKLDHQIESYDTTTGTLLVWVEVPTLSYNTNTALYLYYGNAGAADQWNDAGTWESNYVGVWHLGSDYNDSTANNNDGTNSGSTNYASAKIGAGDDFNGTNANIDTTSNEAKTANSFSISLWFNADSTAFARHLVWEGISTGDGFGSPSESPEMNISLGNTTTAGSNVSNVLSFFLGSDYEESNALNISTAFSDTSGWHHVTVVVSNLSTSPTATMYLDGTNVGTDTGTVAETSRSTWNTDMRFGQPGASTRFYDGGLDEVRLATTTRSADWVKTEYNNQNVPASYLAFGSEEGPPVITSNGGGSAASINVAENSTSVTTVTATDTQTLTYSIIGGNDAAKFTIDSGTGALTFVSAPNREAPMDSGGDNVYDVTVQVSDGALTDTQAIAVTVTDVDEFNVGAVSDANAGANAVNENAANGTTVSVTGLGTDADATNSSITYSLDDNAGGRFAIHSSTGVVTVADGTLLNREAAASHSITIRATSSDTSFSTAVFTINLTDVDEFDVGAVSDSNAAANAVNENAANGTALGVTGLGTDADATTNTITYSLDDNAGGRFAIHSSTGVVTVADGTLLNREAAASHNLTIRATSSDTSFSTAVFAINVNDVDEFDVGAVSDSNAGTNSVNENAANGTTVGVTGLSTDADATTNTITYSLDDNAGGRFAIHGSTGAVTVADGTLLNRETAASHNITIRATSSDTSFGTAVFTINLNDVDEFDVGAVSDSSAAANAVNENAANGTTVGVTGLGTDADATTNTITYSLDDNAGGRFAIHGSTGVVTVANGSLLNREAAASHNITIRATSSDTSFSTAVFTINLNDVDEFDVGAVSDSNAATNAVNENAANGTAVGLTGLGTDADATTNTITYSLDDNAGGRFAIHSSTGVVTVADGTLLNRETAASHNITIRATSSDTSFSTAVFAINVNDVNEFDVGAVSDSNAGTNSVNENAANGTAVGVTGLSTDADATTNTITYLLDDNAGGRFAIHNSTGVVTVADGTLLNREAAASHNITIRATSSDASFSTAVFTINLNDVDEFDVGVVSDTNAAANAVNENASAGTTVGITALASDADAATSTITFSLDDNAGGHFTIHSSTGVVTVAGTIDRETVASYNITVRATSADASFSTQAFTITINDVDEFDVAAVSDGNAAVNAVDENASIGTAVGITAMTSDADATTNAISYSLDDSAGGRFAIDSNSGAVTVAGAIDREAASSYNITVRATSADTSFSTQSFSIAIGDVDEFNVGAISDADAAANTVSEAASIGATVGITALAVDGDATDSVSYTLDDDASGRFAIQATTGVVTVAGVLDYETNTSHAIIVRATSSDGSYSTLNYTLNISDANESAVGAISDTDPAPETVAENSAVSSVIGITALATDPDVSDTVSYSLDDDAGGRFAIHATTGVVTVNGVLDREAAASYAIVVRATSSDSSFNTRSFTIALSDVDEFDTGAISDSNVAANAVNENAANGTTVGVTAAASDADATNHAISYSLDDNAGGRFAINAATGAVTVADGTLLNREASASYNITVRATSSDTSSSTQIFTINLNDVDEFDVSGVSDGHAAANAVDENVANGTSVGITAIANELDATNNTITYSLDDSAGGRFAINASTGVVTVADGTQLNREAAATHNIIVRATGSDTSFSTAAFTISLNDIDEFDTSTVVDVDAASDSVLENASAGTVVCITAWAFDADATVNVITYSLDDSAGGLFVIDGGTGVVTVNAALDYETATGHGIVIRATSVDGSFSTQSFTITVADVNESGITAISDTDATSDFVLENAANGTGVSVVAFADDADGSDVVTYSLDDSAGGRFSIDSGSGAVTVAAAIDREMAASYNITVRASSTDTTTTTRVFTIAIGDVDEFNTGAVGDSDAAANSVAENASIGTEVGIAASALDADATNSTITYSLQDSDGGNFAIDANTGVVTAAAAIDRETLGSNRSVTVRATSADGSFDDHIFSIAIQDIDEADVTEPIDTNATANAVAENVFVGTLVGITASSSDADASSSAVTYSLFDNDGGRFTVDANSGVVSVAAVLNRETLGASRNIIVRATSADGSTADTLFTISLTDVDEFDTSAVADADAASNSVAENFVVGTAVGITGLASDADATTSGITYSLDNSAGGLFAIDGVTGLVTVFAALDFETATSHNITVRATSADGSFSTQSFSISVTDVNESGISAISDLDASSDFVLENAPSGTVVGVTAMADDVDGTDAVTYSLDNSAGGRFSIDSSSGVVTVATVLDRELAGSYDITVRATSTDTTTITHVFTISIGDVDEFDTGAVADSSGSANAVDENSLIGSQVGIAALATDADAINNTISYSLLDSDGGNFAIDANSGVVTVAATLNRESLGASRSISVRATSADGSHTDQVFAIAINDVDEFDASAVVDANAAADSVAENATVGSTVGISVVASDADATGNAMSYSLLDNDGGRFAIDSLTGIVTVGGAINRETDGASRNIAIRATSSDGSFSDQMFAIAIVDVNDTPSAAIDGAFQLVQSASVVMVAPGLLANDTDEDGDILSAVLIVGAQHGVVTLNSDGSFAYTPDKGFSGSDQFQYAASDGLALSAPVTVEISVNQVVASPPPSSGTSEANRDHNSDDSVNSQNESTETVIDLMPSAPSGISSGQAMTTGSNTATGPLIAALFANSSTEASSFQSSKPDQPDDGGEGMSVLSTLDETVRTAAHRFGESIARPIQHTSFGMIADTVLTLAFDRTDTPEGELAWQKEFKTRQLIVGSTAVAMTSLSVGYGVWLLRGGTLLASFLSSIPAWCFFDPLPIVESYEEIDRNNRRSKVEESLTAIASQTSNTSSLGQKLS